MILEISRNKTRSTVNWVPVFLFANHVKKKINILYTNACVDILSIMLLVRLWLSVVLGNQFWKSNLIVRRGVYLSKIRQELVWSRQCAQKTKQKQKTTGKLRFIAGLTCEIDRGLDTSKLFSLFFRAVIKNNMFNKQNEWNMTEIALKIKSSRTETLAKWWTTSLWLF